MFNYLAGGGGTCPGAMLSLFASEKLKYSVFLKRDSCMQSQEFEWKAYSIIIPYY